MRHKTFKSIYEFQKSTNSFPVVFECVLSLSAKAWLLFGETKRKVVGIFFKTSFNYRVKEKRIRLILCTHSTKAESFIRCHVSFVNTNDFSEVIFVLIDLSTTIWYQPAFTEIVSGKLIPTSYIRSIGELQHKANWDQNTHLSLDDKFNSLFRCFPDTFLFLSSWYLLLQNAIHRQTKICGMEIDRI